MKLFGKTIKLNNETTKPLDQFKTSNVTRSLPANNQASDYNQNISNANPNYVMSNETRNFLGNQHTKVLQMDEFQNSVDNKVNLNPTQNFSNINSQTRPITNQNMTQNFGAISNQQMTQGFNHMNQQSRLNVTQNFGQLNSQTHSFNQANATRNYNNEERTVNNVSPTRNFTMPITPSNTQNFSSSQMYPNKVTNMSSNQIETNESQVIIRPFAQTANRTSTERLTMNHVSTINNEQQTQTQHPADLFASRNQTTKQLAQQEANNQLMNMPSIDITQLTPIHEPKKILRVDKNEKRDLEN